MSVRPPRALFPRLPRGQTIGPPGDVETQREIVREALELLKAPSGPVYETSEAAAD